MSKQENNWVRLEILSVSIAGVFRDAAASDYAFVPAITEMPAIVLELVDTDGNREMAGISFDGDVVDARHASVKLAADHGVPVLDFTGHTAQRSQQ